MTSGRLRHCGLAAMRGGALAVAVAPVITSAYSLTEDGVGTVPPWEPAFSNTFSPLFSFAAPDAVYATYGKLYFFVFLGFLFGLIGLRARRGARAGRLERWGFGLSFVGLLLNLFGNVPDYWIGEDTVFEDVGFVAGTALGLLVLTVGSSLLGVALLRARAGLRLGAWLLALSLPGILLSGFRFGNIPSGPALWYGVVWVVLGYSLWSAERGAVRREAGLR
ncbi:MAG: hypothetical protein M3N10_11555 [Actinomycetota bacterium]|nr:hypothetical protein [Actinomycetota bacterium]